MDSVGGIYGELGWLYRPGGADKFLASQKKVEQSIARTEAALTRLGPLLEATDAATAKTGKVAEKSFTTVQLNADKAQRSIDKLGSASQRLQTRLNEAGQRAQTLGRRMEAASTAARNNAAAMRTATTAAGRAAAASGRLTVAQDKLRTSTRGASTALDRLAVGARAVQGRLDDLGVHAQILSTRVVAAAQAANDQTAALGRLQAQAERTAAALNGLSGAQGRSASAAGRSSLGGAIAGAGSAVVAPVTRAAKVGGAAAALVTGAALWQGMNEEQVMAQVKAVAELDDGTAKADRTFKQLKDRVIELGQSTKFGPGEVASSLLELIKAGMIADEAMSALPGTLHMAAAAGEDLANVTGVQTAVLAQFGMKASEASHVADVLAYVANKTAADITGLGEGLKYIGPQAAAANQSFEDTAAALGILANAGIHGTQAGTVLRAGLMRLQAPTKQVRDHFAHFGVTLGDIYEKGGKGGLKPMAEILGVLQQKLRDTTPAQRDSALAFIFGREAISGMQQLMGPAGDKMVELSRKAKDASGYAERVSKTMQENTKDQWSKVWSAIESAGSRAIERISPRLQELAKKSGAAVNAFTAGLMGDDDEKESPGGKKRTRAERLGARVRGGIQHGRQLWGNFRESFARQRDHDRPGERRFADRASKVAADFAGDSPPVTASSAGKAAGKAASLVSKGLSLVRPAAAAAVAYVKQLWAAIQPARPLLDNVIRPLAKGFGVGLLGGLKAIIPIVGFVARILGKVGSVAKPLRPIFEGLGYVLSIVFGGQALKALEGLSKLGKAGKVVGLAFKGLGMIWNGLTRILGAALGGIGKLIMGPMGLGRFTAFRTAISRIFGGLKDLITRPFRALLSTLQNILKTAVNAVLRVFNFGIGKLNKLMPGPIKVAGHTVFPGVPRLPTIPLLAEGDHLKAGGQTGPGRGGARLMATSDGQLFVTGEGAKKEDVIPHRGGVIVLSREGDKRRNVKNALGFLRDVGVPGYREGGVVGRRANVLKMDRQRQKLGDEYTRTERAYARDGETTIEERSDLRKRKLAIQQLAGREVKAIKALLPDYDREIKRERAKTRGGRDYEKEIAALQRQQRARGGVTDRTRSVSRSFDKRIADLQTELRHIDPGFDPTTRRAARMKRIRLNQELQNLRLEKKRAVDAAGDKARAEDDALTRRVDQLRRAQKRQDRQQTAAKDRVSRLEGQRENLADLLKTLGTDIADIKEDRLDLGQEQKDAREEKRVEELTKTTWDKTINDRKVAFTRAENAGADTGALEAAQREDLQKRFDELSRRYDAATSDEDRKVIFEAMEETQSQIDSLKDGDGKGGGDGLSLSEQSQAAAAMRLDFMRTLGSPTVLTRLGGVQEPLAPVGAPAGGSAGGGRQIVQQITAPIQSVEQIKDPFTLSKKFEAQGAGWAAEAPE